MFGSRTRAKKLLSSIKKFVPHKYQEKSIKFGLSRPSFGLFLTPGLGKTIITLSIFKILHKKKLAKRMLIVAKLRICYSVWPKEIKKWDMPFTYNVLHDSKEYFTSTADIDIINYEGLRKFCDKKTFKRKGKTITRYIVKKEFKGLYDIVVFDESSKLKNTGTQRFKLVKDMLPHIDRRVLLTGSPAPNSLMDLFGQMFVLDNGDTFGRYVTQFKNEYFFPSGYMGYKWKLQPGREDEIYKRIKPYVIRFGDDELDLPPLVNTVNRVQLDPESFGVYRKLEREFIVEVEAGTITAQTAAVASGKLRQVAGGACYTGRGKTRKTIQLHEEKIEECIEIVEELQGSPCVIGYEFEHEKERIAAAFPDAVHFESGKKGADIEDRWNRGEIEVLYGQTSSMAHGVNIQESGFTIILFTIPWNLEDYEQLIRRLWRQGQEHKVIVHHIIANDTVDEDVLMVLDSKDKTQQSFLNAMADRLNTNFKEEIPVKDVDIIIKALPNPPRYVYIREDPTDFMVGMFECIGGWMPDQHQNFIEYCGGKVSKDETLKSLMTKTKKHMLALFKAEKKKGDKYVAKNTNLVDQLKQYYTEVNEMSEAQSKFAGSSSKKKIVKKKAGSKKSTTEAAADAPVEEATKKVVKKKTAKKSAVKKKATAKKKPVAKKKAAKKAPAKKEAATVDFNAKQKLMVGTGTPVLRLRKDILDCVPAGKRGILMGKLVSQVVDEYELSEKRVVNHIKGMVSKGFLVEA